MKKVAAIHDLSCFGRGSLTTVIPVLSGLGMQVCPLPTALLSTQTDGFHNYSFFDLTENMERVISHWRSLGLVFDGIYTGFLGCAAQIELVEGFIRDFRGKDTLIFIDPVMGDNGQMYTVYDNQMVEGMRRMISHAHVITPNLTEAYLLAQMDYDPLPTRETLIQVARVLFSLGPRQVIITGIEGAGKVDTMAFENGRLEDPFCVSSHRVAGVYPGCGDLFSSVMLGEMLRGGSLFEAVEIGVRFTNQVIQRTALQHTPPREGLAFEENLSQLQQRGGHKL